jgi:hypothetical protein
VDDLQAFRNLTLAVMAPELTAITPPGATKPSFEVSSKSAGHDVSASVYWHMQASR